MIHPKLNKRTILTIVFAMTFFGICSMFWDVNGLLKNIKIVKIVISMNDIKAGLEPIQTKTLSTTDRDEIKGILYTIEKPILYKTLPNLGGIPSNTNDRLELIITLHSNSNGLIEYAVTSQRNMTIKKLKGKATSKNVSIFASRNTTWFQQLKELYEDKEQSDKWIEL